jgi:Poly(ADP-ribose) polymerase catalytic domain
MRIRGEKNNGRRAYQTFLRSLTKESPLSMCQWCSHNICFFLSLSATLYGEGVYSATNFSYSVNYASPDEYQTCRIIQCKVLTGEFTAGYEGMKVLPEKSPGVLYDSAVNDVSDPSIFVVFADFHMYPEYIVTFLSYDLWWHLRVYFLSLAGTIT